MHSYPFRRLFTAAVVAALLIAVPSEAARRRAVKPPTAGNKVTATKITGTVLDNATGQPVVNARVSVNRRSDTTDAAGKFELRNIESFHGVINVDVDRSGYVRKVTTLTSGQVDVTVRVVPTPTVTVRKTNGSTVNVDFESIEFGHSTGFNYQKAEFIEVCKGGGVLQTIDRSEFRRLTGPATVTPNGACCPGRDTVRVNVELKTGERVDMYLVDACNGFPNIDLVARDHASGVFLFIPLADVLQIDFP
jgi:hypothetical protein